MAITNFTSLFEVSTLGKKEAEFVDKLSALFEEYSTCIDFAITDNETEQTFFECIRDLRGDPIFKKYNLRDRINLEKPTTNE